MPDGAAAAVIGLAVEMVDGADADVVGPAFLQLLDGLGCDLGALDRVGLQPLGKALIGGDLELVAGDGLLLPGDLDAVVFGGGQPGDRGLRGGCRDAGVGDRLVGVDGEPVGFAVIDPGVRVLGAAQQAAVFHARQLDVGMGRDGDGLERGVFARREDHLFGVVSLDGEAAQVQGFQGIAVVEHVRPRDDVSGGKVLQVQFRQAFTAVKHVFHVLDAGCVKTGQVEGGQPVAAVEQALHVLDLGRVRSGEIDLG